MGTWRCTSHRAWRPPWYRLVLAASPACAATAAPPHVSWLQAQVAAEVGILLALPICRYLDNGDDLALSMRVV